MSKRTITKTSRSATTSGGDTTQIAAKWTEKDTTEYVYALRVMTTKKGKPRKIRRYAMYFDGWEPVHSSIAKHLMYGDDGDVFELREHAEEVLPEVEFDTGCTCKVVKIAIREVDDAN